MIKRILTTIILFIIAMYSATFVYASWAEKFPIYVTDTSNTTRTYIPVMLGFSAQTLIDSGKIDSDGLNTNMQIGATSIKYMLSTANVTAVIPSLPSGGLQTLDLYTGYSPDQSGFPIIPGDGGYVTTIDTASMEGGGNFTQQISGGIVTDSSMAGKRISQKTDAYYLYTPEANKILTAISSNVSLDFERTNSDNVSIPDSDNLTFNSGGQDTPFSVSGWIKLEAPGFLKVIIAKQASNTTEEWIVHIDSTNHLVFTVTDPTLANYLQKVSAVAFTNATWGHFSATYDGSENISGLKLYVNGVYDTATTNTTSGNYTGMSNTTSVVTLGCGTSSNFFDGVMSNITIHNIELSQSQVTDSYERRIMTANLVAWWRLVDNAGNPVDSSGNGHSATTNLADWVASDGWKAYGVMLSASGVVNGEKTARVSIEEMSLAELDSPTLSTIDTSTQPNGWVVIYGALQDKILYSAGRYWVFFKKHNVAVDSQPYYSTSVDGSSWTAATAIATYAEYGHGLSVSYNGTKFAYASYRPAFGIYYRQGTLNADGSITWDAVEQLVYGFGGSLYAPDIKYDSTGHCWISWSSYGGAPYTSYVTKNDNTNGTWSTSAGFPYQLGSGSAGIPQPQGVPLTGGKMYYLWAEESSNGKLHGKLYNSGWGAVEHVTSSNISYSFFSGVAYGDVVHVVSQNSSNFDYFHVSRNGAGVWSAETYIDTSPTQINYAPLAINPTNGDMYLAWENFPTTDHIYYSKYTASLGTWGARVDWLTDATLNTAVWNGNIDSYWNSTNNTFNILYLRDAASPFDIRFATATYAIAPQLTLYVNSILQDSEDMTGITIPDNSNPWILGGALSYTNNETYYVDGVLKQWLQPNTMIIGTTIPDRSGNNNNGIITWGNNTNMNVSYGVMSSSNTTSSSGGGTTGFTMAQSHLPSTWFAHGENVANLPFYDAILEISLQTGQPVQIIYLLMILGFAFGVFFLLTMQTRAALLGVLGFNIVLFIGSSMTIVPMWIPFCCLIVQIGIMYLYKQVAY